MVRDTLENQLAAHFAAYAADIRGDWMNVNDQSIRALRNLMHIYTRAAIVSSGATAALV